MFVRIRRVDEEGDESSLPCTRVSCDSMDEPIADMKQKIADHYRLPDPSLLRIFFAGKELQSQYTIFHYGIKLGNVILVLIRDSQKSQSSSWSREESTAVKNDRRSQEVRWEINDAAAGPHQSNPRETIARNSYQAMDYASSGREGNVLINSHAAADARVVRADNEKEGSEAEERDSDEFFSVRDFVDALHPDLGCWLQARVQRITCYHSLPPPSPASPSSSSSRIESSSPLRPSARAAAGPESVSDPADADLASRTRYYVKFLRSSLAHVIPLERQQIRQQSSARIGFQEVHEGALVLANFNLSGDAGPGFWYDCLITNKDQGLRKLFATVFIGGCSPSIRAATSVHEVQTIGTAGNACIQDQRIRFPDELYLIAKRAQRRDRSPRSQRILAQGAPLRQAGVECAACRDDTEMACKVCSCTECGGKEEPDSQILVCDECSLLYHFWCLPEPLHHLPPEEEDWFCPSCKNNDLQLIKQKEAEHLARKEKLRLRLLSSRIRKRSPQDCVAGDHSPMTTKRVWGRGMACVGRRADRVTSHYSSEFFGPIPGVEVGTWFRYRFQVSEVGLHGPLVAGICGKENAGASSIVFSCSYPEDIDRGEEIFFTASGGRNLTESGSRTGVPQTRDQQLTRSNKALAVACYANLNTSSGASAGINWQKGKAIRVLRSGNARGSNKKSPFLPKIGIRYDGIYKVVKYWSERNDIGLIVWRFLLRRDDPAPAPWTRDGRNRIRRLHLDRIIEPEVARNTSSGTSLHSSTSSTRSFGSGPFESEGTGRDRQLPASAQSPHCLSGVFAGKRKRDLGAEHRKCGKRADRAVPAERYKPSAEIDRLIDADSRNARLWDQIRRARLPGEREFLQNVSRAFQCVVCLETVLRAPVTTKCGHNICRYCLFRSFDLNGRTCPVCRTDLSKKGTGVNRRLQVVLEHLLTKPCSGQLE